MVTVTSGMVRFCQTNDELALVVGHEMAHNAMNHMKSKRANAAGGLIVDILFAAIGVNTQGGFAKLAGNAYSPAFEQEADYVGLYYTARAGFDISSAANFWRRMAIADPGPWTEG
jgi:predicted Zn-dependent protease